MFNRTESVGLLAASITSCLSETGLREVVWLVALVLIVVLMHVPVRQRGSRNCGQPCELDELVKELGLRPRVDVWLRPAPTDDFLQAPREPVALSS
jgi:hypothetical protein